MIDKDFKGTKVIHGDILQILPQLPDGVFGGVVTDPPYCSGDLFSNNRRDNTANKYLSVPGDLENFDDCKDQRSFTSWSLLWMTELFRVCKSGAPVCLFIDWRQLPTISDVFQWAGFVWRGVVVWDKGNSRPQLGRFKQQAEFVLWGSKGDMPLDRNAPCLSGVFAESMPSANVRVHQTQKPIKMLGEIIKIVEPGEIILDPFCGSGTTLVAAAQRGYPAVGIDNSAYYADIARRQLEGISVARRDKEQLNLFSEGTV
jgi:site-specific DNA-methyltransferase (adenine-specific)